MSVGKSASESSVVLGRDPVFQEGHTILLKKIEDEMLVFNILDMTDDDDKVRFTIFADKLQCLIKVEKNNKIT
jgi:hypothetical protein